MKRILFAALLLFFSAGVWAQATEKEYQAVDEYVKKLPSLDTFNMGSISKAVTKNFATKELKVRAIYTWIANNIAWDMKAMKNNDGAKSSTADVLKYRKAIGSGFANLFQDMCSSANIRCLTVDGYLKHNEEEIGEKKPELNHTWAVVQLGQSPETWFYADPCLAAGHADAKGTGFIKEFDASYFFSNKKIFNNQHYPDNEAWKLENAPKNLKDFYELPVTGTGTYHFGITAFSPNAGVLKTKTGKAVAFDLTASNTTGITKVAILIENNRKITEKVMNYTADGGHIRFSYTFNEDIECPLTIVINGIEVLKYRLTVE